jgi:hypothetical protein
LNLAPMAYRDNFIWLCLPQISVAVIAAGG